MISFTCKCANSLSVPQEMAGLEIQCPKCGLLNDVPLLGDLRQLYPDGTYVVDAPPPEHDPGRLAEIVRVFGREKTDAQGEIDLRQVARSPKTVERLPGENEHSMLATPRYDLETGELIPPFEIKPDDSHSPASADIPMATRVLPYAVGPSNPMGGAWGAFLLLLTPLNLVVMLFVLLVHGIMTVLLAFPVQGISLLYSPILLVGGIALVAHYVSVITAVGPDDRDELPRMLGDLSLVEDIWSPFVSAAISLLICYAVPLVLVASFISSRRMTLPIMLGMVAIGTLLFPAVLLTGATSGTVVNLRPDRIWKLIGTIGTAYVLLVFLYILSTVTYFLGVIGAYACLADLFSGSKPHFLLYKAPVAFPMLILGILMTHYFCWMLGLAYRQFHERFPWVLQMHHRAPPVLPGLHSNVK